LARLVGQTRRVGSRGSEDEPLSPIVDDQSRRGSEVSHGHGFSHLASPGSPADALSASFQAVFANTADIEIRRELERCQAVYDGVRRFVLAAAQCGIHLEVPPNGVLGLFGLLEDDQEGTVDGESEADALTGEGSWEEDHGFRFRVRSGSISRFGEGGNEGGQTVANNTRYAIRARRFADTRPGHNRRRAGSNASVASGYASGSGYGSNGSKSAGPNGRLLATIEGIERRLEQSRLSNESSRSGENADIESRRPSNVDVVDISTPPESEVEGTPGAASALAAAAALRAARSMGDIRGGYQIRGARENHIRPQAPEARFTAGVKAARRARVIHGRPVQNNPSISSGPDIGADGKRLNKSSISSISSAESSSSALSSSPTQSSSSPATPELPSGQCTVFQVLQALRVTQDRILHGTAAFIGAAQYHSRTSHPASKGYLVSLTREIVDQVRRLLIIADAILGNSTIRTGRAREVEMAGVYKARLYVEMNRVVDAVRDLTAIRRDESDGGSSADHGGADADEEEKGAVLKRAHLANKCAAELVLALKLCLSFRVGNAGNTGEGGLMITIPEEAGKMAGKKELSKQQAPMHSKGVRPNMSISTSKSSVASSERSPKPYSRFDRVDGTPAETAYTAATRNRSFTTRNEQVDHEAKLGLHKKSVSMVGMSAIYRNQMAQQETRRTQDGILMKRSKASIQDAMETYLEMDEERDEESDGERHPLLMSESYDSDGQEEIEETILGEYAPEAQYVEEEPDYIQVKPARRSVEQVRLSLERGLRHRPSMNLVESSTPLDGTEVVEIVEDDSEDEVTLAPSISEKELPEPPRSAPLTAPPTRAPPPKPAHHDNLVVSNNGNIVFKEGVLVGATLQALVDRMTPADVIGDTKLASHFLLTFRLFATPNDLVDAVIHRFNYPTDGVPTKNDDPISSSETLSEAQRSRISNFVQLRVLNFVKDWTKTHWYPPHDQEALPKLLEFFRELVKGSNPMITSTAKRMLPSIEEMSARPDITSTNGSRTDTVRDRLDRMRSAVRLRDQKNALAMAPMQSNLSPTTPLSTTPLTDIPRPELNKAVMNQLRARQFGNVSLLEFSPIEMARQLTLLESRLYCALPPEELIEIDIAGRRTPHVKALTTLSTTITGWVTDWILKEGLDVKKRVAYIKFFLKVGKVSARNVTLTMNTDVPV
jgi:hypothetical protein